MSVEKWYAKDRDRQTLLVKDSYKHGWVIVREHHPYGFDGGRVVTHTWWPVEDLLVNYERSDEDIDEATLWGGQFPV